MDSRSSLPGMTGKNMKAAQYNQYGGPEVIEINPEATEPIAGSGQILVEVYAASLNPVDFKFREGYMKEHVPANFPVTIGGDFSGVIKEVGEGVTDFKAGDEVYGQAGIYNGGSGSFAEMAVVNTGNIAQKPKSLNHEDAAAMPLVGASAVQALEEHIKLQSGQKLFINGGAGGIGSVAVEIAKALGAYVAATAGTDDVEFVKSLDADEVIDYRSEDFSQKLKDYDAAFDTVGGESADKLFQVVKHGGVIVSMVGAPNEELAKEHEVTAIGQGTKTNTEHLQKLAELIDAGKVKVHIEKTYPLDQAKEAFEHLEKQSAKGKIVVKIRV